MVMYGTCMTGDRGSLEAYKRIQVNSGEKYAIGCKHSWWCCQTTFISSLEPFCSPTSWEYVQVLSERGVGESNVEWFDSYKRNSPVLLTKFYQKMGGLRLSWPYMPQSKACPFWHENPSNQWRQEKKRTKRKTYLFHYASAGSPLGIIFTTIEVPHSIITEWKWDRSLNKRMKTHG